MRHYVLVFVLLAPALGAPNWAAGQKQTEEEKLYGTWVLVAGEIKGEGFGVKEGALLYTFSKGGKAVVKEKGGKDREGAFKIDATKNPKEIDLTDPKEADKDKV